MRVRQVLMVAVACAAVAGCGAADGEPVAWVNQAVHVKRAPVGLSLRFKNGQAAPLRLLGNFPRYLQEIDVTESVASSSDDGIAPLIAHSSLSGLDWTGVAQVEELWVPSLDGTFTRERY